MVAESGAIGTGVGAPRYFLTPDTFLARADGVLVFLDLRSDEYLCLEPSLTGGVSRLLGLPLPGRDGGGGAEDGSTAEAELEELVEAGLITADPGAGKPALPGSGRDGLREMPRFDIGAGPKVRARHVAAFVLAFAIARSWLRLAPIHRIVGRVARRKAKRRARNDVERARELSEIYRKLRPLFMSRKDQCLLNSLLLIEFLARFGLYPSWHFGVRVREFSAHCWVEDEGLLYDDDVENVCKYAVIMKV